MTAMDWNDLASQPLPSLGGGVGSVRASASSATTARTNWGGMTTTTPGLRLDRPWTQGGTNTTSTTTLMGTTTGATTTAAATSTVSSSLSLEDRLKQQEQEILETLVRNTAEQTRHSTADLIEAQLQKEWDLDKERWRKDVLGPRHATTSGGNQLLLASSSQSLAVGGGATSTAGGAGAASSATPSSWPRHRQQPSLSDAPLPVALVQSHLAMLQRMEHLDVETMAAWVQLASLPARAGMPQQQQQVLLSPQETAYRSAWLWMQHLVACGGADQQRESPIHQAAAALSHLCLQFQSVIQDRNRQAVQQQQQQQQAAASPTAIYQNEFANQCAMFTKLTLGLSSSSTNNTNDHDAVFWPTLFYCLRSGHAVAALHVYQQHHPQAVATAGSSSSNNMSSSSSSQHHPTVLHILQTLARSQGSARCLWLPSSSSQLPHVSESDRRLVADLWQAAQHREPPAGLHEQGVYAFLSGQALPSDSSLAGLAVVEDYLAGSLWKALLVSPSAAAANQLQLQPQQDTTPGAVQELEQLGKWLRDLGPEHFDDSQSGGWSFAWPLLLTQQYESALVHLTEAGGLYGLLQATHLAYVLSSAGVPLHDMGATTTTASLADSSSSTDRRHGLVTSLLVSYAQHLLGHASLGPTVALVYLVRIPDARQARREVSKLIATTGELSLLVGGVNLQGKRIKDGTKTIDLHFTDQQVAQILEQAAELLLRGGVAGDAMMTGATPGSTAVNPQHKELALMCYMLAERYADVLQLLNQLLCPPEQPDERRTHWLSQLDSFRDLYLNKRTHVVQVLEAQNKMSLVETSRTLVELNAFFGYLRQNQYEQAWLSQQRLNLLPTSSTEMNTKVAAFHQLDPLVKQSFPALLVGVMKLLHAEHSRLKRELHGSNTAAVARERLKQIREQGKLLVTLAGMVGIVGEQLEQLSRLDCLLI